MNLYLLSAPRRGYDTYLAAVVVAPDAETARTIHPDSEQRWIDRRWQVPVEEWDTITPRFRADTWALHPDEVEVTLLGTAAPEYGARGPHIVLSDYLSG